MDGFHGSIQPEAFSNLDRLIEERLSEPRYPEWVPHVVVPHLLARNYLSYGRSDGPRSPDDVLSELQGDCEDRTALLCSMYAALGYRTAIKVVDARTNEMHSVALVQPPIEPIERACDLLLSYYRERHDIDPRSIGIDETELGEMLVVGSTMTDYVGDVQSLGENGYVEFDGDGRWNWYEQISSYVY